MNKQAPSKGLGRGLSALIAENTAANPAKKAEANENGVVRLPLDKLEPGKFQARKQFTKEALEELSLSIKKNGVVQPVLVRQHATGNYEIIAGERRCRASKLAGLKDVPAIVLVADDRKCHEISLIENIQRQDLLPLEEAAGYLRLIKEFSYTQETLSTILGKSRSQVTNLLRLLTLPESVKDLLNKGKITVGHARALVGADNAEALAQTIVKQDLTVRETEALLRGEGSVEVPVKKIKAVVDERASALEQRFTSALGTKVALNWKGNKGKLVISLKSEEELEQLLSRLSA